jgi:membrane-associated protease RseP (regulator of RpoE activity)
MTNLQKIPMANVALFLLTLFSTLIAGTLQQGVNPLETPSGLLKGIPFSFTLLLILGAHEFGHYFISKRRHINVTLPYFIPAPSFVGTFGAFIKMKAPITDRRTLLDIGVAGPLAGMIFALPVLFIGLTLSEIVPETAKMGITLGASILFSFLSWLVHGVLPEHHSLILHPIAFSGWIGLLVTSLNLLPIGQLDGGHIAYAIFGSHHKIIAKIVIALLIILGLTGWTGWLVWAGIILVMGIKHPPVLYDWMPLDKKRKILGWVALSIFLATFIPIPFLVS